MIDETLVDAISDITPDAVRAEVIQVNAEPPHVYWMSNRRTGGLERHEAPPTPRRDIALTLDGIAESVRHHTMTDQKTNRPIVAVGEKEVVFLPEQDGHRRVTLELKRSEQFRTIEANHLAGVDQKKLDWILRTVFKDQVAPEGFAHSIRQLRFTDDSKGTSTVSHGRESMGVSIEREVSGASEIPDEIVLTIPVYEGVFWQGDQFFAKVRCAVHIDAEARKFTIRPLSGEISKALSEAREWIRARLVDEVLPHTEGVVQVIADLELVG